MIINKLKYFLLFCLLAMLHGCGPGKSVTEPVAPRPDWVIRRPIVPGYYIGIGWAQKMSNIQQYQQTAKQNALSDLASEISISISSSSVLHAFESKLGFSEDFSSTIQARTNEELQGFDIVDSWEDQNNYWIYYRLSASRHQEIKETKKNDAARLSTGIFERALDSRDKGMVRLGLVQLINAMEPIKNWFDDPLQIEFKGRDIQLGNEIFNELSATISQIQIEPQQTQIEIKAGQEVSPPLLRFNVSSTSGPVSDLPLVAVYSERPIRNNRQRTASDGSVDFSIDAVRSSRSSETFTVTVDIDAILAEATTDPMIRRLLSRFSKPSGMVRMNILKPVIMLASNEQNIGSELSAGSLRETFRKNAIESGYILNENPEEADYIVRITAYTVPTEESGIYKNAILIGTISAELSDGNVIFHRELEGFRGSHFELDRAGEEAFRQAVRRMDSSYFREIDEALKRTSVNQQNL